MSVVYKEMLDYIDDDVIMDRGYRYYKRGHVRHFSRSGDVIEASVSGSRQRPYTVQIKLGDNGFPVNSWCNCPYSGGYSRCKHIAAVIFHYSDKFEAEPIENPIIRNKEHFSADNLVRLGGGKGAGNKASQNLIKDIEGFKSVKSSQSRSQRFRLIFVIGPQGYHYSYEDPWTISLKLQYIKKSGEPGRVTHFREDDLTEDVSREERLLMYKLKARDRGHDGLSRYFGYLLKNRIPTLYMQNGQDMRPVSFEEISRVDLSFILTKQQNNNFLFGPDVKVVGKEDESTKILDPSMILYDGITVLIVAPDGRIFYKEDDEVFYSLFTALHRNSADYTYEDIKRLKAYLGDSSLNGRVSLSFDMEAMKTIYPVPKTFIEIHQYRGIKAQIYFDYMGREAVYGGSPDLLILDTKDREYIIACRNRDYEKRVYNHIKRFDCFENREWYHECEELHSELDLGDFLAMYGAKFIEEGIEIRIKGEKHRISGGGRINVSVGSGIDWFDIKAEYEDERGGKSDIILDTRLLEHGLVRSGSSFTIVKREDIEKLQRLLKQGMGQDGGLKVSNRNFQMIDELYKDISDKDVEELQTAREIGQKLKNFEKIQNHRPPGKFDGKLRHYQTAGYNWLHFLNKYQLNGCLADDMGLGKTIQALALIQSLKEEGNFKTSLVVVPVTTIANWESEIDTFTPKVKYISHLGSGRTNNIEHLKGYDLIIVSYQTLRRDIEFFNQMKYGYVILDESQNIKNSNSLTYRAIKTLKSDHRLSLTGTPIENNTLELWAQMEFLNPGILGNIRDFKRNYATAIEVDRDKDATDRLKKTIFPFILRRRKDDVARDLPEKSEIVLYTEMNDQQADIYRHYRDLYKAKITKKLDKDGLGNSAIEIFAALLKLRQIALFPVLADKKYATIQSSKFDLFKDTIDEILQENHKIVVFSQFVKSLKIIENHVIRNRIEYSYIDGSLPSSKRKKAIKRFQEKDDVKLFLLSLKAGGVGINLTAADYVILFDPWWNPAVEIQAIDRTHRIGQMRKVIAYKMIVKDTVEEKILELQEKKKELVKNIITTEASFYKSLKKKDIIDLFK